MAQFSILLSVNLAALVVIFLYVRRRVRKTLELDGLVDSLRKEVGELVRDLNQTTDRNITLVEDAMVALREAAAEADKRVVVLRRETDRRSNETALYDRMGRMRSGALESADAERAARPLAAEASPGTIRALSRKTEQDRPAEPISQSPPASVPFVTFSSTPIRPKPPVRDEVLSLSRKGFSSGLIAAKLGITVAEVELIVSLEEQKGLLFREEEK